MNLRIPNSINQWLIEFDPYGFTREEGWLESAEKTEDILQLAHVYADGPIIDVGWYAGLFRAVVVRGDWTKPIETVESKDAALIEITVYKWLSEYENG